VSSFLTAHQHILGYSVPFIDLVLLTVLIKIKVGYNQGYLATVKMNGKYVLEIKRKKVIIKT